jgi:hypothetical protein
MAWSKNGTPMTHENNSSHGKKPAPEPRPPSLILPPRNSYQTLFSYQKAEVIYLRTCRFCSRFLKKGDRTVDQMVRAVRSGKQNIIEGSRPPHLEGDGNQADRVARASLEELFDDYLE